MYIHVLSSYNGIKWVTLAFIIIFMASFDKVCFEMSSSDIWALYYRLLVKPQAHIHHIYTGTRKHVFKCTLNKYITFITKYESFHT